MSEVPNQPYLPAELKVAAEFSLPPEHPAVGEIIHLRAELQKSKVDKMTGLWRRDAFIEKSDTVRQAVHEAAAAGTEGHDTALMFMLDLKRIHRINKRGGHPAGDQVITSTGKALGGLVSDNEDMSAIAGRLGGDEFAILVTFSSQQLDVERVQEYVFARLEGWGHNTPHGLRIGKAALSTAEKTTIDLFREADPKAPQTRLQKVGKLAINAAYSMRRQSFPRRIADFK